MEESSKNPSGGEHGQQSPQGARPLQEEGTAEGDHRKGDTSETITNVAKEKEDGDVQTEGHRHRRTVFTTTAASSIVIDDKTERGKPSDEGEHRPCLGQQEASTEAERDDASSIETEKRQRKEDDARKAAVRHRNIVFATTIGLASLLAGILWELISRMSDPARVFAALLAVAGYLVVSGLVFLVVVIPAAGSNPEVKTEFYSARAAYFCVISGLVLVGIVTIGILIALIMTGTGGRYVPGTK